MENERINSKTENNGKSKGPSKNKMIRRLVVLALIVLLVLFFFVIVPFLINCAYLKDEGFITAWDGSEFLAFYGAALSAIGALFLGAISIWQNRKLREQNERLSQTNDTNQEKLNQLTKDANTIATKANDLYSKTNEQSVINKIIEHEENRLQLLTLACNEYEEFCGSSRIHKAFDEIAPEDFDDVSKAMNTENERLYRNVFMYFSWQTLNDIKLKKLVTELKVSVYDIITEKDYTQRAVKVLEMLSKKWAFQDMKDDYLREYQNKLEDIIFKDISLIEIRNIYERKQEAENGQVKYGE